ncbi:hypothetical protein [Sphingobacterium sp. NPDC055431]
MKTVFQYLNCIFASHRYFLISIPVIAIIIYLVGLIFASNDISTYFLLAKSEINDNMLINLVDSTNIRWSFALIVGLPFIHLTFISNLFYKSYDFTIPMNSWQKLTAYLLIGLFILFYNYLIILGLNYIIEIYFRQQYWDEVIAALDRQGKLYTEISKYSIFYNGSFTIISAPMALLFFLFYPYFLFAALYFRKYSLVISAAILLSGVALGVFISSNIWEGYSYNISNLSYNTFYSWVPTFVAALITYIGFYYFLKEKEV